MNQEQVYHRLQDYLRTQAREKNLLDTAVVVKGRVLTTQEAIGNPQQKDFRLLKGKEKLLQAEFKGCKGQAFTDSPGDFEGTLGELLERPINSNFEKASFIAVLNAVMRYLQLVEGTIHCKDEEPGECAEKLVSFIKENYGQPRIGMIGLQPALLKNCARVFNVRIVDMDPDNVGKEKYGVPVEEVAKTKEVLDWCDLLLVTGSTVANGTVTDFLDLGKPTIFYGTTIAGAAAVFGLNRFCPCSK
ncbi:MAG: hypothetical protein GX750_06860 [Clostridia bacterium]|nr:hypothetical protein [Clostridia bacterium]